MLLSLRQGSGFAMKYAASIEIYVILDTVSGKNSSEVSYFWDSLDFFFWDCPLKIDCNKDNLLRMLSVIEK